MDERLTKALEFSHYRQTLNNQIELEKTRIKNLLTVAVNGGFFYIDYALITFVEMQLRSGRSSMVLLDKNMTPVKIDDVESFLTMIVDRFFSATNSYHAEYVRLTKSRNVKSLIGGLDGH